VRIESNRSQLLRLTLHPLEIAALLTAARWVVAGQPETPPAEAIEQLRRMLANYENQMAGLRPSSLAGTGEQPDAR
jgi:hypothetical protein